MGEKIKELIILYGDISTVSNWKQQRMIDGGATCGYREYARKFGHIIYLCPQIVKETWDHSMTPEQAIDFINKRPDAVVWSVKNSQTKDKEILQKISNKKVYYSCNAKNRYNAFCDVSLVDTKDRLKGVKNGKLWFKGKDPEYWKSSGNKEYDYVLVGGRGDKNEMYFLKRLNDISQMRKVIWVGGKNFKDQVDCKHDVTYTDFVCQDKVRDYIGKAKVGILFTELSVEGFPQTFLEMTMCGVPVVYNENAPYNNFYFHRGNHSFARKSEIAIAAEFLLGLHDSELCRKVAIENYSIEKSYKRILECLNL